MANLIRQITKTKLILHPSWFLALIIFTTSISTSLAQTDPLYQRIGMGLFMTFLLFTSVLFHELAHSLVALFFGIRVKTITLFVFGGVANLESEPPTPMKDLLVSIAGPAASFLIFAPLLAYRDTHVFINYLVIVNFLLFAFNMLPAFPTDGGRILRDLVWYFNKNYLGSTGVAVFIGLVMSFMLIALGVIWIIKGKQFGLWLIINGAFIYAYCFGNRVIYDLYKGSKELTVNDVMVNKDNLIYVDAKTKLKEFIDNVFVIHGFHGYPVISKDKIVGLLTFWHIKNVKNYYDKTIEEIMLAVTPESPAAVQIRDSVDEVVTKMQIHKNTRLLVYNEDDFVGMLTQSSVIRAARHKISSK